MVTNLSSVILAGGVEHRINNPLPRILQPLSGVPVVGHVLKAIEALGITHTTVVSNAKGIVEYLGDRAVHIHRDGTRGSGDALNMAKKRIEEFPGDVLVVYGDRPLFKPMTLKKLVLEAERTGLDCAMLTVFKSKPHGHARVMRDGTGAIKQTGRDCEIQTKDQQIQEVIAGAYFFRKKALLQAFEEFKPESLVQFYVTDITTWLAKKNQVVIVPLEDAGEAEGVYSFKDLAAAEAVMQTRIQDRLMGEEVRIIDPRTTWISAEAKIGKDTVLMPNTVIEGPCEIGENCVIGPFARVRAGVHLGNGVKIGNFVEVVRSRVGDRTRILHLAFVGDADISPDVVLGAGTITANSDSNNLKHRTVIEDDARIGSGTILVAPVKVGRGAATGAGSVIPKNQDVPNGETVMGVPAKAIVKTT